MLSVNFTKLDEELKTFILSVAVGPEVVVENLIDTANRHLDCLKSLKIDTPNVKLHFKCSVDIITKVFSCLVYINFNSTDLFNNTIINSLDKEIESIDNRFTLVLDSLKKEIPTIF